MKALARGLVLAPALLVVTGLGAGALGWRAPGPAPGRVYPVDRFLSSGDAFRMRRGQSAAVRGWVTCGGAYPGLCAITGQAPGHAGGGALLVYQGSDPPLLAALRTLSVVAPWLPRTAAHPLTGREAVYRVTFVGCPTAPACDGGMTAWRLSDGGSP